MSTTEYNYVFCNISFGKKNYNLGFSDDNFLSTTKFSNARKGDNETVQAPDYILAALKLAVQGRGISNCSLRGPGAVLM